MGYSFLRTCPRDHHIFHLKWVKFCPKIVKLTSTEGTDLETIDDNFEDHTSVVVKSSSKRQIEDNVSVSTCFLSIGSQLSEFFKYKFGLGVVTECIFSFQFFDQFQNWT